MEAEFLQPANEVWGKVIFSQACFSHSVHGEWEEGCVAGGHMYGRGACMVGGRSMRVLHGAYSRYYLSLLHT